MSRHLPLVLDGDLAWPVVHSLQPQDTLAIRSGGGTAWLWKKSEWCRGKWNGTKGGRSIAKSQWMSSSSWRGYVTLQFISEPALEVFTNSNGQSPGENFVIAPQKFERFVGALPGTGGLLLAGKALGTGRPQLMRIPWVLLRSPKCLFLEKISQKSTFLFCYNGWVIKTDLIFTYRLRKFFTIFAWPPVWLLRLYIAPVFRTTRAEIIESPTFRWRISRPSEDPRITQDAWVSS